MKIDINLLPSEILSQQLKRANFNKIQTVGVIIILVMIFLTSLIAVMRILQSRNIAEVQAKVTQAQRAVAELKDTQAVLLLVSDRLGVINEYWGVPSKQFSMYKLINELIPPQVMVNGLSIDKTGTVEFLALIPDSLNVNNLVTNLITKESNKDSISQVSIENFNRGRDGMYRVSFKVKPK